VQEFKLEQRFTATIVWLILNGKVEKALEILAKKHGVRVPIIEVGLPKRDKREAGMLQPQKENDLRSER
jgi:hypothetical protein